MRDSIEVARLWPSKKMPVILQGGSSECGLACLAMVASYYGKRFDMPRLRARFPVSPNGSTVLDLIRIADSLELASRAVKVELDNLKNMPTPVVLHWNMNHFVVLNEVRRNRFLVLDPAKGAMWLTHAEVSASFTGIALELSRGRGFQATDERRSIGLSTLWSGIRGFKRSVLILIALTLIMEVFVLAAPYYQQLVVDQVLVTGDEGLLVVVAIGFSLLLIFEVISMTLRKLVLLSFNGSLSVQMGANLFRHLIRLPLSYFDQRTMGDVVTRFSSINNIREFLTLGLVETLIDSFMVFAVVLMLYLYSPLLATIMLISASLYASGRILLVSHVREASRMELESRALESSAFMETVRGMQTIKLFCAQLLRESSWKNLYVDVTNRVIRLGLYEAVATGINRLIFGFATIVSIYIAAKLVIAGTFSIGMLLAFLAYSVLFIGKTSRLVDMFVDFKLVALHLERLSDIVLTETELIGEIGVCTQIRGFISVKNVTFSYGGDDENVLEKLSFDIFPGESVALVGRSGCGKTTVMKVMLGLLKPLEGEVFVDDVALSKRNISDYRNQIGSVMQDDVLFAGSVRDNIGFFEHNIDDEWIQECAKVAKIFDYISALPMGFDSLVGDMGTSLSGGQKQRILLARALYRKPKILFLDEATSHLDVTTENAIGESISFLSITRVIIAHRAETIAKADRVIDIGSMRDSAVQKI